MIRKLFSIGLALVLGQVAVAQEYDDVYFSAKDRSKTVFVKNSNNSIFSPNTNNRQQADDPLSNNSGNLQNKFANPEYNGQASNNAVNMPYYRKEVSNNAYFNSLYTNSHNLSLYDNFNTFGNASRYSFWADPRMANYYGFNNFGYNYGCPTSAFSMGFGTGFNRFNSWNWGMNSWGGMNSFWGMNSWNSWNNWNRWGNNSNVVFGNDNWNNGQRRGVYQGTRSNRSSDFSINQNQRTGRTGGRTEGWNSSNNSNWNNSGTRESRTKNSNSVFDRSSGYENRNGSNSGGRSESRSSWGSDNSGGGRSSGSFGGSSGGGGRSGGSSGGGGGGGGRSGRGN